MSDSIKELEDDLQEERLATLRLLLDGEKKLNSKLEQFLNTEDSEDQLNILKETQAIMAELDWSEVNIDPNPGNQIEKALELWENDYQQVEQCVKNAYAQTGLYGFHAAIKDAWEEDGERIIQGYASTAGEDRDGEYIPPEALDLSDYNGVILYNHGRDPEIGRSPVGKITHWMLDKHGLWVRGIITKAQQFGDRVWKEIQDGILNSFSIGAPERWVKKVGSRITHWPIAEISTVSVPSQARATFTVAKSLKSLGEIEQDPIVIGKKKPKAKKLTGESYGTVELREAVQGLEEKMQELLVELS